MPVTDKSFLQNNWSIITGIMFMIFTAGGIYAEFQFLQAEIDILDQRLEKKIQIINELEKKVDKLELNHAYMDGYKEAKDKCN